MPRVRLSSLVLLLFAGGCFRSLSGATLEATPATFDAKMQAARPGDIVLCRAGSYARWANKSYPSGTSSLAITVKAFPGEKPVFENITLYSSAQAYLVFDGIKFDARRVWNEAFQAGNGAHHISLLNSEITGAGGASGLAIGANDCVIRGNDIHHNGVRASYDHGIYTWGLRNLFEGNSIHHNAAYGIHNYSMGLHPNGQNIFRRNHVWANGTAGGPQNLYAIIVTHSDGTFVEYNTIDGGGTGGIALYYGSKNCRINNNSVIGNSTPWFDLETGADCTGTANHNKVNPSKVVIRSPAAFIATDNSLTAPGASGGQPPVVPAPTGVTVR